MSSIFSKIIVGEIPCYKIFENDLVLAFLDINPVNLGHTLIVPKIEIDHFSEVPDPYYTEVFQVAKQISDPIQKATGCLRVCSWVEGFLIPHFHYHLCPIFDPKELWNKPQNPAKSEDLEKMCNLIIREIQKSDK